jgi:hypothetical protein
VTLPTSRARIATVIGATTGITGGAGLVHDRIRTGIERSLVEAYYLGSGGVNCWEIELDPEALHGGASGYLHTEGDCEVLAHYMAADASASRNTFSDLLALVQYRLLDPTTGMPQITGAGVRLLERPSRPIRLVTGQAAYRARLRFRLWDVAQT